MFGLLGYVGEYLTEITINIILININVFYLFNKCNLGEQVILNNSWNALIVKFDLC